MFAEIKAALTRTAPTLMADAVGVVALLAILVVSLSLPQLV